MSPHVPQARSRVRPQHSPSPSTFPRLRALLSTTTSCSFCWSSLLTPRLPTAGQRDSSSAHVPPAGYPHQSTGEINPRTRELHGSPAVGLLGRVADRQLQVVAAERVPGGTQTDLAGLRVPCGRNPLPGAPGETRAPQSISFPSDWTAAIAHRVRAKEPLVNKADLSRSESQRVFFFGGGNGILIS